MMWVIAAMTILTSNTSMKKTMGTSLELTPEICNIMMMSMLVMLLNHTMMNQGSANYEGVNYLIITAVGIMVMFSFTLKAPFSFLVMMEATIVPLAYMVMKASKGSDKVKSLKFMVMMNTAGSVPFMSYVWTNEQTMMLEKVMCNYKTEAGLVMFFSLFLIKAPMFLAHVWLTKVHVSASGNCSMILASIMIKLGTLGIMKFYKNYGKEKMFYMLMSLSLLGSVYLSVIMARFYDAKTMIAMSSVLHMAMMLPMMIYKKDLVMAGSIMMMTSHGLISYYLFYLITVTYEITQSRTSVSIKSMESSAKILMSAMMIFMFLNMGIPPFMNFFSETIFLIGTKTMHSNASTILMALSMVLSMLFTMQMNSGISFGKNTVLQVKSESVMMMVKTVFFLFWSLMILCCM